MFPVARPLLRTHPRISWIRTDSSRRVEGPRWLLLAAAGDLLPEVRGCRLDVPDLVPLLFGQLAALAPGHGKSGPGKSNWASGFQPRAFEQLRAEDGGHKHKHVVSSTVDVTVGVVLPHVHEQLAHVLGKEVPRA